MGPRGATIPYGPGAPCRRALLLPAPGVRPTVAALLLLPLFLLHALELLSPSSASLVLSGVLPAFQGGPPPLTRTNSQSGGGAPRRGPCKPLSFQFGWPLVSRQTDYEFDRKGGGVAHRSRLSRKGPLGPPLGALHESSAPVEQPRLRPLFPELQSEPEGDLGDGVCSGLLQSTASSELTTMKFCDIPEIQPITAQTLEKRGIVHLTNIQSEVESVGKPLGLNSVCLYGGVALQQQLRSLREASQRRGRGQGIDVVVATPGRLIDFMGLQGSEKEAPQNLIQ
ncbi:hypothetical protein ACSSS7_008248 [Eimeria intestinalis]